MADKPLKIPFMIMDKVKTPPEKQSGHRSWPDMELLSLATPQSELLI